MANKIYFVSLETLKKNYPYDWNLEDSYILPNITKAQDFRIRPLIGKDKYDEIATQIESGTVSASNETILKTYLQPIIAYYVMAELVYTLAYKLKNEGVTGDSRDSSNRFNELVKISEKHRIDSEHYEMLFKDYMCDTGLVVGDDYRYQSAIYLGNSNTPHYHTIAHKNNKKLV